MDSHVSRDKINSCDLDGKLRDQLISDYAPLVRWIALKIMRRLPSYIVLDDLVSEGMIGLMNAIDRFDPSRNNTFKTYAEYRIRGAIIDYLREQDILPRSLRDIEKKIHKIKSDLEQSLCREPTCDEVALGLNLDRAKLQKVQFYVNGFSNQTTFCDDNALIKLPYYDVKPTFNSTDSCLNSQDRVALDKAIQRLSHNEKNVVLLYYFDDASMKEIGILLNISESRVSQIHRSAVRHLKQIIGDDILE